jgi:hypothetical protein
MDAQEILTALKLGEDKDWEFKAAKAVCRATCGKPTVRWQSRTAA